MKTPFGTLHEWVSNLVQIFQQAPLFRSVPTEKLHNAISVSLKNVANLPPECRAASERIIHSAIQGPNILFPGTESNTLNAQSFNDNTKTLQGSVSNVLPKVTAEKAATCFIGTSESMKQVSSKFNRSEISGLRGSNSSNKNEVSEPHSASIAKLKRKPYNCGRCGVLKVGHKCPFRKVKKKSGHSVKPKIKKPATKGKPRGPYFCGDCGLPTKGHRCQAVEVKMIVDESSTVCLTSQKITQESPLVCEEDAQPVTDEVREQSSCSCFGVVASGLFRILE